MGRLQLALAIGVCTSDCRHDIPEKLVDYKSNLYRINYWMGNGTPEYDRLRPLSYPGATVYVLLFSVMDPESLTAAETHFLPEIQKLGEPGAQFVLVGAKIDLRDDAAAITVWKERTGLEPVTSQLGEMKARDLGFFRYHEISALRWEGIDELLQLIAAAHASGLPRPRDVHKGAKCALM